MTVAGISEVKAKLSKYLARVRNGDEVVITDRGRPVARLVAARPEAESLSELERRGAVKTGFRALSPEFLKRARPRPSDDDILSALIEERREGR